MKVAFTGHRPPKGRLTYSHMSEADKLAVRCVRRFLADNKAELCIVGGALGFDTLAARAAFQQSISYHVYVPFTGQESKWPVEAQRRYHKMLELADKVIVVSAGGFSPRAMQVRNEAMVDACDHLVAWWDGASGGTWNCIQYAGSVGVPFTNLYMQPTNIQL